MTADLRIERHIDQTPESCFDLWTHPDQVAQWWGPKDYAGQPFKARVEAWSLTAGEAWAISMTAPDGTVFSQSGTFLEVERPRMIRLSFAWLENGQRGPETEIRVAFNPDGNGTRLVFEQLGFADTATRDVHIQGWQECLDRFARAGLDLMQVRQ
ncbi:SRPBCC domain-containing protein [Cognatiyoonia sp. IB215182]|uniref:SRPBCC family protein n=1 Tax=Cognatiyoonia sp. IB215182 TaxID=3097353 RepID=UPI002A0AC538|nr:SRPBCC domain-containing protein [Cognatiyoonia sp. IB215182]MDX8354859.1 SRPBCC domain-containing protein [Cognatiyoonia sp. IB215182]